MTEDNLYTAKASGDSISVTNACGDRVINSKATPSPTMLAKATGTNVVDPSSAVPD